MSETSKDQNPVKESKNSIYKKIHKVMTSIDKISKDGMNKSQLIFSKNKIQLINRNQT